MPEHTTGGRPILAGLPPVADLLRYRAARDLDLVRRRLAELEAAARQESR